MDRLQEAIGGVADRTGEDVYVESAGHKRLRKAVLQVIRQELSPHQRQVVLLYFFEGKNIPTIAAELGVNKSTVSRTLARAKQNLRRYLQYLLVR